LEQTDPFCSVGEINQSRSAERVRPCAALISPAGDLATLTHFKAAIQRGSSLQNHEQSSSKLAAQAASNASDSAT
jgi:hypothetical protein